MSRPRILVTGGAVAAKLDAVKLITNKFKGGWMLSLAHSLSKLGARVNYLASDLPRYDAQLEGVEWVKHSGFDDYMEKVQLLSKSCDAVVLGAAVANLILDKRWQELTLQDGKFPSHNYEEGDPVPVLMRIAPRVINTVRKHAPKTKLIGFKLLSGVDHDSLIRAAQLTQRESKANLVFANDATDLHKRFGVTPEGGEFFVEDLAQIIFDMATDEHYKSISDRREFCYEDHPGLPKEEPVRDAAKRLIEEVARYRCDLELGKQESGIFFGCVAVRVADNTGRFVISARGKTQLLDWTVVCRVDHKDRTLVVPENKYTSKRIKINKASLNAPLIDRIFKKVPEANAVIHWHEHDKRRMTPMHTLPYAQPGTVRDTDRDFPVEWNENGQIRFTIAGHGEFLVVR